MRVQELRVGNLVESVICKEIYVIDLWALRVIEEGNFQNSYDTENKVFQPLKPSIEWLSSFGFEEFEKDCRTFFVLNGFKVEMSNGGNIYYKKLYINSIHQLQNLYFDLKQEELIYK